MRSVSSNHPIDRVSNCSVFEAACHPHFSANRLFALYLLRLPINNWRLPQAPLSMRLKLSNHPPLPPHDIWKSCDARARYPNSHSIPFPAPIACPKSPLWSSNWQPSNALGCFITLVFLHVDMTHHPWNNFPTLFSKNFSFLASNAAAFGPHVAIHISQPFRAFFPLSHTWFSSLSRITLIWAIKYQLIQHAT